MAKDLILIDFDNTLFFTDKAIERASKEILRKKLDGKMIRKLPREIKSKIYGLAFSKHRDHSIPNTKLMNRIAKKTDARIVILTARSKVVHRHVVHLLRKNGMTIPDIIYRKKSEFSIPDEEWKKRKITEFSKRYNRIDLYEDKIDNIKYIKSGLDSKHINFFLVKGNTIKKV